MSFVNVFMWTTASSPWIAPRLARDLNELLARGGFHLTKWVSTSEAVMKSVRLEDRAKSKCNFDLGAEVDERVLGMKWNVTNDTFGYQVRLPDKPITRRGLPSVSSSLFDPLGLASPVVLEARLLLRSLCQSGLGWDDLIPSKEAVRWRKGLTFLEKLQPALLNLFRKSGACRCMRLPMRLAMLAVAYVIFL